MHYWVHLARQVSITACRVQCVDYVVPPQQAAQYLLALCKLDIKSGVTCQSVLIHQVLYLKQYFKQ